MVRIKDFCGAVFHPQDYQVFLHSNIEHLQSTPMSKRFNTGQMLSEGKINCQKEACLYVYQQVYQHHTSLGILAQISIEDYSNNKIKRHQRTLSREGFNHQSYRQEHVGPVVVSHRNDHSIQTTILASTLSQPFARWNTKDGRKHTLWRVRQKNSLLVDSFAKIQHFYILDGHHRLEAAHQNYLLNHQSQKQDVWIQALIYSSQYVTIHPQHRVIREIPADFKIVEEIMKLDHLELTELQPENGVPLAINQELHRYEVILKLGQKLYGINFKNISLGILEELACFRLQQYILAQFFDEQTLKQVVFVPGIVEEAELFKHQAIFFVRQFSVETLFQIADLQVTMPPKSSWIQPKPCSHMVIRLLH